MEIYIWHNTLPRVGYGIIIIYMYLPKWPYNFKLNIGDDLGESMCGFAVPNLLVSLDFMSSRTLSFILSSGSHPLVSPSPRPLPLA